MALPYHCLFSFLIPGSRALWPLTILVSLACIGLLAACILLLAEVLCVSCHLQPHFVGVTLLALGAQLPNTFASLVLTFLVFFLPSLLPSHALPDSRTDILTQHSLAQSLTDTHA